MALFGKKKEPTEPPVDRVRTMMRSGMSEKDIVRQLKAEGFSFGEIEKALMAAVKEGASPLPSGAEMGMPTARVPMQMPVPAPEPVRGPEPAPEPAQPMRQPPQAMPPAPMYRPAPAYPSYAPEDELEPEVIMEELIESVAEEKFEKFSNEIKSLKSDVEGMNSKIDEARKIAATKPAPEIPKELADRLDDFEARLGGLEKAFKQFLPSLAENIETISKIIAERKRQAQPSMQQRPSQMKQQRPSQMPMQ